MSDMKNRPRKPVPHRDATTSLSDADMTTSRVDRRSFLSRAVLAGSVAVGAALTAACPSGEATDSDGEAH